MKLAKCVPKHTDLFRPMSVLLLECQWYQLLVHAASGIASQGVCGVAAFLPLAKPGAGMQRVLRRHPVIHSLALPGSGIMCRGLSICACFRMRGKLCVRACLEAHPQRYAVGGPLPVPRGRGLGAVGMVA